MAAMVKEKRKEKKKAKDKIKSEPTVIPELAHDELCNTISSISNRDQTFSQDDINSTLVHKNSIEIQEDESKVLTPIVSQIKDPVNTIEVVPTTSNAASVEWESKATEENLETKDSKIKEETDNKVILLSKANELILDNVGDNYVDLNRRIENISIPKSINITDARAKEIANPDAYLFKKDDTIEETCTEEDQTNEVVENEPVVIESIVETIQENVMPSAPVFEEDVQMPPHHIHAQKVPPIVSHKVPCTSLDEAIKEFGGKEMEEVRVMSEKEEAIVEEGPTSGPEHPLVDLLSTFRSSLMAMERESVNLTQAFSDQEKSILKLWKIEKRYLNMTKPCGCGANVDFRATYEHAELLRDRLPAAKLRLEGLLRDVQESYCHHQHEALLAHYQIDELISETVQSSKADIREALSLILQALRDSDGAPDLLADALQQWAATLAAALVDRRDMRQLLFLLHHLFRQTRSVQWAVGVIDLSVQDSVAAARVIALLDILLARSRLDTAVECTEDTEEVWEEIDKHGDSGAVSEGVLRERDLLSFLYAFPFRELIARLVLFTNADVKQAREYEWGDVYGGRGMLKACYGVRALLATLHRAAVVHAQYTRLFYAIREIASRALLALSCLNLHSCFRGAYANELRLKICTELEAAFAQGFVLFGTEDLHKLPATLLMNETARDYCNAFIVGLHDKTSRRIEALSVDMPIQPCDVRVRIVVQVAVDRLHDHELARTVLEFLFLGIKSKIPRCQGGCESTARDSMPRLLAAHPYLHALALHMVAEMNQVEPIDPANMKPLSVEQWRPMPGEIRAVLDDWSQRAAQLLQHLLLALDYTPFTGLPLDVQLTIGSFLCTWIRSSPNSTQEWCWEVLRRLRVHRIWWKVPLDAPPPDEEPTDLFTSAYAILSTSWGHCIPLICSEGVSALCKLAATRVRDAIHCLAPIMIVMAHSPESVSLTPKFMELFTIILNSGPSLVQRALGRGGVSGSILLLQLILKQLEGEPCCDLRRGSILSAWMHALWRYSLPSSATAVLDTAALACREWPHLDAHATILLQEENNKDTVTQSVRNVFTAPLLCECILRTFHASKETYFYTRLLAELARQRANGQKIHVDNALQQIGANMSGDELVIYRSASAAMAAPLHHPSHLALWRLFMHLYLQRPPDHLSSPAVGPLFFSGIIKSRTLNQIKKRLQDTATYHYNEAEALKIQQNVVTVTEAAGSAKSSTIVIDSGLLPTISIKDLTGQSSESNSKSASSEEDSEFDTEEGKEKSDASTKTASNLQLYHEAAEKLIRQYLLWLEEGDKVKALPHQADIARFIPQQPLETSWRHALTTSRPSSEVECESPTTPIVLFPQTVSFETPFQLAVRTISEIKDRSRRRAKRKFQSILEKLNYNDTRILLNSVKKHLKDIENLAQEWSTESSRISSLDAKLWEFVCTLRVRRPLPAIKKQCPNKCKPITLYPSQDEWCLSTTAERGIKENRSNARSCIRRLARPRPHAARTVAALHTIARRINDTNAASRVLENTWLYASACCYTCAPAKDAITTFTAYLAERWICHEGKLCADMLSRWSRHSKNALQQSQCGALVSPQRLPLDQWPIVYVTLLRADLPQHMLFSYLSKFDMTRWSAKAEPGARRDILEALTVAVQRWGSNPDQQYYMLLDLLEMHTFAMLNDVELCAHITRCARATVNAGLPARYWNHVAKAVERVGGGVPFDQLGHLLRELGVMWWEARTGIKGVRSPALYAPYSPYIAHMLNALLRAFVTAAMKLSYAPKRVALYAWSAVRESWAAWIVPSVAAPPLLPSLGEEEAFTPMLKHFVDALHQVMLDCPGSEICLLQNVFEWAIQTYLSVQSPQAPQETSVQMSALLAELTNLPWTEHQWCYGKCLQIILQICTCKDKEVTTWCCQTWRGITAETWLLADDDGVQEQQLAPRLATLLYLFTGTEMPHNRQTLDEATRLPWWRLPEAALGEAMDRFFATHHNTATPYHEMSQFRVILSASELCIHSHTPTQYRNSAHSRQKRCAAVSQLVRAACAPTLASHVTGHCTTLLKVLTQLAPCLDNSSDEIEELLGRAIQIMCMEPAAVALPIWERWLGNTSIRMVRACVSAAGVLTAFEYFAAIADTAIKTLLLDKECGGWDEVMSRLWNSPWREPHALLLRGRLHAAYACALEHAQAQDAASVRRTFTELRSAKINFVDNEAIVALWICYACRIVTLCRREQPTDMADCVACVGQLMASWANPPRRSLLRVVALQADNDRPTQNHRVICRLALCLLNPNDESLASGFETACVGPLSGMCAWGRSPTLGRLVRLAITLYPEYDRYFKVELDLSGE